MLNKLNKHRAGGFTLVEIMIVVAIVALLAGLGIAGFLRARKRAQASKIINDLRMIDSAVDQYALENNKGIGEVVPIAAWTSFLKIGTKLYKTGNDVFEKSYGDQSVEILPAVPPVSFNNLSDVADAVFFSPLPDSVRSNDSYACLHPRAGFSAFKRGVACPNYRRSRRCREPGLFM